MSEDSNIDSKQSNKFILETERRLEEDSLPSSKNLVYAIILITVCGFSLILTMQNSGSGASASSAQLEGENLVIEASKIGNSAKFFYYDFENVRIQFFAVMGSDSNIHVALDACDVCYAERQGYTQQGSVMVCKNCGNQFQINGIGTENLSGGCWPSYVPFSVSGDKVLIPETNVAEKKYMFG
ncbi:MAG: Fe-S-containing protein [Candidatus Hodarchaeales archaeon]|jgi:uncharacterized membrane protein